MKKLVLLLLIIFAFSLGACGEDEETLVVGTSAGFRPFEYMEGGEVVGFDIDLMKEIAKKMDMKIKVEDLEFEALIPAVKSGTIDVIASGMTINEKRKEQVDFSEPYFTANQSVLVRENFNEPLNTVEDLNNEEYIVGVQNATTGAFWADANLEETKINKYSKYIECIQDLENKNIHMIILDKPTAEAYEKNRPVKLVMTIETDEQYGFAVKKDSELLDDINKALKEIKNSDTWLQLQQKYFGAN
jgi:polar amino acid transport system substrate-binding protein